MTTGISDAVERRAIETRINAALLAKRTVQRITGAEIVPLITAIGQIITQVMSTCDSLSMREQLEEARADPDGRRALLLEKRLAKQLRKERERSVKDALKAELDDDAFWAAEARNAIRTGAADVDATMAVCSEIEEIADLDGHI